MSQATGDPPSENTPRPSGRRPMQLVAEREVAEAAPSTPPSLPSPRMTTTPRTVRPEIAAIERELGTRLSWKAGVIGSINVVAAILAVRLILLVAIVGAIILTWFGISTHDVLRIAAVGVYTTTVVCPLIWLSAQRR